MSSNLTKNLSSGDVVIAQGSDIYNQDDRRAKALKRSYFKMWTKLLNLKINIFGKN